MFCDACHATNSHHSTFEDFIELNAGPYAGTRYVEKKAKQKFSAMVESVKQDRVTGRLALSSSAVGGDLATPLKERMQKKRKDSMSTAQQHAKVLVAERGAMKVVKYSP